MNQAQTLVLLARIAVLQEEGKTTQEIVRILHDEMFVADRKKDRLKDSNAIHEAYVEWIREPDYHED